ncbi:MAG: DUF134 domain-containing protein [Spirochaetales bacterium]|nr:DUF134 domain-containing protein [Spirochaetales bacterium]
MAKPKKDRRVQYPPSVVYFKPQGIPMIALEQETLAVDEYEAIRLVDSLGLDQQKAAERMGISRATCARIVESAHKKVARALTEGKAIRIEGGNVVLNRNRFRCMDCGTLWEGELTTDAAEEQPAPSCPRCLSSRVLDFARQAGWQPSGTWGGGRGGSGRGAGRRTGWNP